MLHLPTSNAAMFLKINLNTLGVGGESILYLEYLSEPKYYSFSKLWFAIAYIIIRNFFLTPIFLEAVTDTNSDTISHNMGC